MVVGVPYTFPSVIAIALMLMPIAVADDSAWPEPGAVAPSPDEVQLLQDAAMNGDPEAQEQLCVVWFVWKAGLTNAAGLRWCRRAADKGSAVALTCVAETTFRGQATVANPEEGLQLLRRAAEQGELIAQLRLADRLFFGGGVPIAGIEGCRWYRKIAAKAGDPVAQRDLAMDYESGGRKGVEKDLSAALKWYREAARSGDVEAQFMLGAKLYAHPDFDHDYAAAWFYLTLAAEQGHQQAKVVLEELAPLMTDHQRGRAAEMLRLREEGQP